MMVASPTCHSSRDSRISGNRSHVVEPNGRFATGGGMFVAKGALDIRRSAVSDNSGILQSDLPGLAPDGSLIIVQAVGGGILLGDGTLTGATLTDTALTDNVAAARNPEGQAIAIDAAMEANSTPVALTRVLVAGNHTSTVAGDSTDAGPGGSAIELDGGGTVTDSRIVENPATFVSPNGGLAQENGGLGVLHFSGDPQLLTVSRSVIAGNSATATSATGTANAHGGGIYNNSLLALDHTLVAGNRTRASAPASGTASR